MARTKGDTSPTYPTTARFIAVDDNAVATAKPIHAAAMRRIARNGNWLECEIHRTLFHHQFPITNEDIAADRSADPFVDAGQVILLHTEPMCFGPWRVDSHRKGLRFRLGVGLENGGAIRYAWEFYSENPSNTPPSESEWTTLENTTGATAWRDSSVTTRTHQPRAMEWVRLWLHSGAYGYWVSGQPDNTQGKVLSLKDSDGTVVDADHEPGGLVLVECQTRTGVEAAFTGADYSDFERLTITLFEGTHSVSPSTSPPTITRSLVSLPCSGSRSQGGAASFETMEAVNRPYYRSSALVADDGVTPLFLASASLRADIAASLAAGSLKYAIYAADKAALRYAFGREDLLGAGELLDDGPHRASVAPIDDKLANIGRIEIRHLLVTAQDNVDALVLGQSQPLVNERLDIYPARGSSKHSVTMTSASTTWTTVAQWATYIESGYQTVSGMFEYWAVSTYPYGPLAVQARLVILDNDGTTVLGTAGTAVDMEGVRSATSGSWWPGPWWNSFPKTLSPLLSVTPDAADIGASRVLGLQLRAQFTEDAVVTVAVQGAFFSADPRIAP